MQRLKGLYILDREAFERIYGTEEQRDIDGLVDILAPPQAGESIQNDLTPLADVEVIFSGWGAPLMDETFLAAAPKLRAVFYAAGSVRSFVTEPFWKRGIILTTAATANAVPVSEYTLAAILFGLKLGWRHTMQMKREARYPVRTKVPGCYDSIVGLVSLGLIGRLTRERLRPFDLRVAAYDPFVKPEYARELDVELLPLDELFRRSDAVSLHTPLLKETEGMITGAHIASMKEGATFINTARGAIVRENEMIEVLKQRPDLQAVLDVTYPEPPAAGSPLYTLPNVILTPHIAGSMDAECRRMGRYMVEELRRYVAGKPLRWQVTREAAANRA
jgi:phosphoglycerate dehydrogenase-like enzyme